MIYYTCQLDLLIGWNLCIYLYEEWSVYIFLFFNIIFVRTLCQFIVLVDKSVSIVSLTVFWNYSVELKFWYTIYKFLILFTSKVILVFTLWERFKLWINFLTDINMLLLSWGLRVCVFQWIHPFNLRCQICLHVLEAKTRGSPVQGQFRLYNKNLSQNTSWKLFGMKLLIRCLNPLNVFYLQHYFFYFLSL
jgi:hypothetical protein